MLARISCFAAIVLAPLGLVLTVAVLWYAANIVTLLTVPAAVRAQALYLRGEIDFRFFAALVTAWLLWLGAGVWSWRVASRPSPGYQGELLRDGEAQALRAHVSERTARLSRGGSAPREDAPS